ncbi:hypothetical protein [Streptomyces hainanensis]|uniref:hypothetical protein n=1 Tax=Streptomyces hainanensis TaxID=402648 RepID=UPI001A9EFCBF
MPPGAKRIGAAISAVVAAGTREATVATIAVTTGVVVRAAAAARGVGATPAGTTGVAAAGTRDRDRVGSPAAAIAEAFGVTTAAAMTVLVMTVLVEIGRPAVVSGVTIGRVKTASGVTIVGPGMGVPGRVVEPVASVGMIGPGTSVPVRTVSGAMIVRVGIGRPVVGSGAMTVRVMTVRVGIGRPVVVFGVTTVPVRTVSAATTARVKTASGVTIVGPGTGVPGRVVEPVASVGMIGPGVTGRPAVVSGGMIGPGVTGRPAVVSGGTTVPVTTVPVTTVFVGMTGPGTSVPVRTVSAAMTVLVMIVRVGIGRPVVVFGVTSVPVRTASAATTVPVRSGGTRAVGMIGRGVRGTGTGVATVVSRVAATSGDSATTVAGPVAGIGARACGAAPTWRGTVTVSGSGGCRSRTR